MKSQIFWLTHCNTSRPMLSMPQLLCVAQERGFHPGYHNEGSRRPTELHCLFQYTLSGEGACRDAAGERRTPAGHGFLCMVNAPELEYYHPGPASVPWDFVYACFTGSVVRTMVGELLQRHGSLYKLELESLAVRRLLAARRQAEEGMDVCPGEGAEFVMSLLAALDASKRPAEDPRGHAALIRKAKRLLVANLPKGISVGAVADALGVTREHLSRVFAKETGITASEHLARLRMFHACRLLKESELGVKEIAAALGVDIPQNFARLFKKNMGMTPSQFRRHGAMPIF